MFGIRLFEVNLFYVFNNGVKLDYSKLIRLFENRYDSYKFINIFIELLCKSFIMYKYNLF